MTALEEPTHHHATVGKLRLHYMEAGSGEPCCFCRAGPKLGTLGVTSFLSWSPRGEGSSYWIRVGWRQ